MSAAFRSDQGGAVLIGLKDCPRTSASFGRTLRSAMRGMGIPTNALRGHWCTLMSEREAVALCTATGRSSVLVAAATTPSGSEQATSDSRWGGGEDDGVKIALLR